MAFLPVMAQDYSGQNLRGCSFKGQNLSNANFSGTNLQGANFASAILQGASFNGAQLGVSRVSAIGTGIATIPLILLCGVVAGLTCTAAAFTLHPEITGTHTMVPGLFTLLLLIVFTVATIRRGLWTAVTAVLTTYLVGVMMIGVVTIVAILANLGSFATTVATVAVSSGGLLSGFMIAGTIAIALVVCATSTDDIGSYLAFIFVAAVTVILAGNIAEKGALYVVVSEIFAIAQVVLGRYMGKQATAGNDAYAVIREAANAITSTGGTNFQNADLTDATFTNAMLEHADFRGAVLVRTGWLHSQGINHARFGKTNLNRQLRHLLITGEGNHQDLKRQDLHELNLQAADLSNAILIGANLSRTNLQAANLSGAILAQAQLEQANLSGADLTGTCIDNWGVTTDTTLDNIQCGYVYLRYLNGEKQERFPSHREFREGEFIGFIESILNTIDLYHEQNVSPRAVITTLNHLSADYQEPLEIVVLEKRNNQSIIKLKQAPTINKDLFTQQYYSRYEVVLQDLAETPENLSSQLEWLNTQVSQLAEDLETLERQPKVIIHHLENDRGIVVTGGTIVFQDEQTRQDSSQHRARHGSQRLDQATSNAVKVPRLERLTGTVRSAIDSLPQSRPFSENYQTVLRKLHAAIVRDQGLTIDDKIETLEKLVVLIEVWQSNWNASVRQRADNAIRFLKGTSIEVAHATLFNESCRQLLPAIMTLLNK